MRNGIPQLAAGPTERTLPARQQSAGLRTYSRPLGSSSLPVEAEAWVGGIEAQLREAQSSLCAGLATAGDEHPARRKRAPVEDVAARAF